MEVKDNCILEVLITKNKQIKFVVVTRDERRYTLQSQDGTRDYTPAIRFGEEFIEICSEEEGSIHFIEDLLANGDNDITHIVEVSYLVKGIDGSILLALVIYQFISEIQDRFRIEDIFIKEEGSDNENIPCFMKAKETIVALMGYERNYGNDGRMSSDGNDTLKYGVIMETMANGMKGMKLVSNYVEEMDEEGMIIDNELNEMVQGFLGSTFVIPTTITRLDNNEILQLIKTQIAQEFNVAANSSLDDLSSNHMTRITSLTIPNSVNELDPNTFERIKGLKELTLPSTLVQMPHDLLNQLTNLEVLRFLHQSELLHDRIVYEKNQRLHSMQIPTSLRMINGNQVIRENRKMITIPTVVTRIENETFDGIHDMMLIVPGTVRFLGITLKRMNLVFDRDALVSIDSTVMNCSFDLTPQERAILQRWTQRNLAYAVFDSNFMNYSTIHITNRSA